MLNIKSVVAALLQVSPVVNVRIAQCTTVATAAKHKHVNVQKHSTVLAQLHSDPAAYTMQVREHTGAEDFTAQRATFTRDPECAAIVTSAKGNVQLCYYALGTEGRTHYTIDGVDASKEEVAELLTPSAREAMLNPQPYAYNAKHDLEHNVHIRTVNIANIVSIVATGEML